MYFEDDNCNEGTEQEHSTTENSQVMIDIVVSFSMMCVLESAVTNGLCH